MFAHVDQVHLKELKTDIDKEELARKMAALTPGFTGESPVQGLCPVISITSCCGYDISAQKLMLKVDSSREEWFQTRKFVALMWKLLGVTKLAQNNTATILKRSLFRFDH